MTMNDMRRPLELIPDAASPPRLRTAIRARRDRSARRGSTSAGDVVVAPSSKVRTHRGTKVKCRVQVRPGPLRRSATGPFIDDGQHRSSEERLHASEPIGDRPVRGATDAPAELATPP